MAYQTIFNCVIVLDIKYENGSTLYNNIEREKESERCVCVSAGSVIPIHHGP